MTKTKRVISGFIVCFLILAVLTSSAFAALRHENPDEALQSFDGTSLFRYYIETLDFTLLKKPLEVEARLSRMPFANLPPYFEESTSKFTVSSIELSYLIVDINKNIGMMRTLLGEFRLSEIIELSTKVVSDLSRADELTENLKNAIDAMGKELKVQAAKPESELRIAFNDVLKRIAGLGALTSSNMKEFTVLQKALSTLELILPTQVTLKAEASSAFVGDTIDFHGWLTSEGKPLAGREVVILVNGSSVVTAVTGDDGYYKDSLKVPYLYVPEIDIQAKYVAKEKDVGLYLSSVSPIVKLQVLFYKARFEIAQSDKTFLGLEKEIHGWFYYDQYPVLPVRKIEIYLDDILMKEERVEADFSTKLMIKPDTSLGKHRLTLSAVAEGRYSQETASATLNVTQAVPALDIKLPAVALIPGNMSISGKLSSEVGPLKGASIDIMMGDSQVRFVTEEDGSFRGKISMKVALDLIGTRNLGIQVSPQEPWNAPLSTTRNVVMVNMVNSGSLIFLIIVFRRALTLRGFKRSLLKYRRKRTRPELAIVAADPFTVVHEILPEPRSEVSDKESLGNARESIFYLYKSLMRLLERITRKFISPHHTFREFAYENSKILGPLYKHFFELTKIVEKLRYSRYTPDEKDMVICKQLSSNIEAGLKNRNG